MNIKVTRFWHAEGMRLFCKKHWYYTAGNCKEYNKMLDLVEKLEPTPENIYTIAKDIAEHSDESLRDTESITNIMYFMNKEVIATFFEVEE